PRQAPDGGRVPAWPRPQRPDAGRRPRVRAARARQGAAGQLTLAVTGAALDGEPAGLRAEDGLIAEIGAGVEPRAGDEVIDASGLLLCPPMVNGHTHA